MFDAKFDDKSVKSFNDKIELMFRDIEAQLNNPRSFDGAMDEIKSSMKAGISGVYQNSKYSQAKNTLKTRGLINHNVPFAVTGHLIDDMKIQLMNMSPNQIEHAITFSDIERLRPTIWSMYQVAEGKRTTLEFKASSSSEVAMALNNRYPLMMLIQKAYEDDFIKHVNGIIARAMRS